MYVVVLVKGIPGVEGTVDTTTDTITLKNFTFVGYATDPDPEELKTKLEKLWTSRDD